jgi:sulfatase maturation enzyme AslB (radical SAM superfamily)
LDNFLLQLLFKKEIRLLKKKNKKTKGLEKILSKYVNYQNFIFNKGKKLGFPKNFLIKKIFSSPTRLILLITHNCQLKCRYCRVRKFSASMKEDVLFKAIDLLFTSNRKDLQLQFFGGEPLLCFDLVKKAVKYAEKVNKKLKRNFTFILTTNGLALTREKTDFLRKHNFLIECSIDGETENQLKMRQSRSGINYYSQLIDSLTGLFRYHIPHYSISVIMPNNVDSMYKNFKHLANIGFKRLQMNYSLGVFWPEAAITKLFEETNKIISYLEKNKNLEFINLTSSRREPVVLNAELTVDCDGSIYLESGICLEENFAAMKKKFLITHINKAENINLYTTTPLQNFYHLSKVYGQKNPKFRKIILNNILLGSEYNKFLSKKKHAK